MDKTYNTMQRNRRPGAAIGPRRRQRGVIAPLTAVAMLGLVAVVGLALDMGHAYLDRTRLQNALDAAALSGAKTLDETKDTGLAETAARTAFTRNADADGNAELQSAGDVDVGFAPTLLGPFTAGDPSSRFIRVAVDSFVLPSWLLQVVGRSDQTIGGSAVAGPSPVLDEVCNILPVAPCGTSPSPAGTFLGYKIGDIVELKTGSGNDNWDVGPGNYQNVQLDCGPGGSCVRDEMAGRYAGCAIVGEQITTQPGDKVGPNSQGINTRFNCLGPDGKKSPGCKITPDALPDVVIDAGEKGFSDTHDDYKNDYATGNLDLPAPAGQKGRREVQVPVIDCKGTTNGAGEVTVLGIGCFFLTKPAENDGKQTIYGEFLGDCQANGVPGTKPTLGPGPHTIILYKDFTSGVDS